MDKLYQLGLITAPANKRVGGQQRIHPRREPVLHQNSMGFPPDPVISNRSDTDTSSSPSCMCICDGSSG